MNSNERTQLLEHIQELMEALQELAVQTAGATDPVFNPRPEFLAAHDRACHLIGLKNRHAEQRKAAAR